MCLCKIVFVRVCMLSLAEHIDYIIYALSCSKIVFRNLNGKRWSFLFICGGIAAGIIRESLCILIYKAITSGFVRRKGKEP